MVKDSNRVSDLTGKGERYYYVRWIRSYPCVKVAFNWASSTATTVVSSCIL